MWHPWVRKDLDQVSDGTLENHLFSMCLWSWRAIGVMDEVTPLILGDSMPQCSVAVAVEL